MELQTLSEHHIPQLLSLCDAVGWLHTPSFMQEQYKTFLSIGNLFGHTYEESLISCSAVFPYETGFTSIGTLIVHPNFQRRGLGRFLLDACIQSAPPLQPFTLIATDAGLPLYHAYGFTTVTSIHRFERNTVPIEHKPFFAQRITHHDLETLIDLDQIASGANRSNLYSILLSRARASLKIERNNRIEAFVLGVQKGNTLCITPLIANHEEDAVHLLLSICALWNGNVRVDVPHSQTTFRNKLQSYGFQETLVSPLMMKNGKHLPGKRDSIFAMMDAALC